MQRVNQMPNYASAAGLIPRQVLQESFRSSYKQMPDKENSYAQLQKRKMQSAYPTYQSAQAFQKQEMRPSSSQQRQPSVQAVMRPSSASTDKRSYSSQKQQPRASFKELKNSTFVSGYQQRYYSMKQSNDGMTKSQSIQQLGAKQIDQQEYKKLHDKLQFLETKINKIKSNIDISNAQLQKQSERQKSKGLAAKFFQKKDPQDTQQSQQTSIAETIVVSETPKQQSVQLQKRSVNLDQFVTQVKQPQIHQQPAQPIKQNISHTINNLLNKVNRHQSLEMNQQKAQQEKSYSSQKPTNNDEKFLYYASSIIKAFYNDQQTKCDEITRDHLVQSIQGLEYAKNVKLTSFEEKIVNLPKSHHQKTIVFDLDETLIHCNESVNVPGDVILPITFPTGDVIQASINIRPFAQQILQTLSRHFEIVVFTASHSCYANIVLDYLDPKRQWISHRLFREHCLQSEEGAYIKDLRVLGNRKLQNILLVDNAAYSFGQQVDNGVPIIAYYENKQDQELLYLQNYLMKFRNISDVREQNSKIIKLSQFTNFQDPIHLLQTLYQEYLPQQK